MFCTFLLVVAMAAVVRHTGALEQWGCYGSREPRDLEPRCNDTEILKIDHLYANAKKNNTGCPRQYDFTSTIDPTICCTFSPDDCQMEYIGVSDYFSECVSTNYCEKPVASQPTTCNGTDFIPYSNYMIVEFTCVTISDILPISSDRSRSGPPSTIGNAGYPNTTFLAGVNGGCSVTASCDTNISVIALDLDLQTDGSGNCQQTISVDDGGTRSRTIDCSDNNSYRPTVLYTSNGHFIVLTLSNSLTTDGGRMWIDFASSDTEAILDVRCGSSALTSPPSVSSCRTTTQSTSTTTSTSSTTPSTSKSSTSYTTSSLGYSTVTATSPPRDLSTLIAASVAGDESLGGGALAGIIICLILLLLIIVAIVVWRLKKRKGKTNAKVSDKSDLLPDDEFAAALGIATLPTAVPVAPPSTSHPPRRLQPLQDPRGAWQFGAQRAKVIGRLTRQSSVISMTASGEEIKTTVFEVETDESLL